MATSKKPLTCGMSEVEKSLTCGHGTPWAECVWCEQGCPGCMTEAARLNAEFNAQVAAGVYCPHGYTPIEAKRAGHKCEGVT